MVTTRQTSGNVSATRRWDLPKGRERVEPPHRERGSEVWSGKRDVKCGMAVVLFKGERGGVEAPVVWTSGDVGRARRA